MSGWLPFYLVVKNYISISNVVNVSSRGAVFRCWSVGAMISYHAVYRAGGLFVVLVAPLHVDVTVV